MLYLYFVVHSVACWLRLNVMDKEMDIFHEHYVNYCTEFIKGPFILPPKKIAHMYA